MCLIFPNLPNGFETGTIKTLSLIIFVGMVWQTVFADDDVSESEFCVLRYEFVTLYILVFCK